ncbi:MAG: hypothetical protein E4H33_00445 [Anaerolineales bacterium]|nr:MAG: hypothetical protein E4H33_00445 [Anaerolineales bacterium]
MKDRLFFIPKFLLVGSFVVLLTMFLVRIISSSNLAAQASLTQTAVAALPTATDSATETPLVTDTPTPEPTSALPTATVTPFPTATFEPGKVVDEDCNVAESYADITIPDKTEIYADHKFTKTWRLLNAGTCTWTDKYVLYFVSGNQMSGPNKQTAFPVSVEPGKSIDIYVELRAAKTAGTYKGFWGLKDQYGNEFGLGLPGDPFYVEIVVIE